jgi:predicted Zn finger-like uncharacterized protein
MDVRCEKCQTEYELDESRLKPGGVTVKCTNCGHMFKIRKRTPTNVGMPTVQDAAPPGPAARAAAKAPSRPPETRPRAPSDAPVDVNDPPSGPTSERQWMVRLENGENKTCRELATLQQWIVAGVATRESLISRSGKTWKRLGDIAELGQYFAIADEARAQRSAKPTGPKPPVATVLGVGAAKAAGGTVVPDDDLDGRSTGNYRARGKTTPPPPPGAKVNPLAQTEMSAQIPVPRRPPTQPPPPPPGNRQTAAWASSEVKASESMAAMPQGPRGGKLSAIPGNEPAFSGKIRMTPGDEASFDTGRVRTVDDDDDLMPAQRGSRAGMWIALLAVLVIGGAAGIVYVFVLNKNKSNVAKTPVDAAAAVAAVVADAAVAPPPPAIDAAAVAPPPADPLDAARAELAGDVEARLKGTADSLAGKDDAASLAMRARLSTALAQSMNDRAGLVDKAEGDKLRRDAKQIVIDAMPLAQKAVKAAADDASANLAMADMLRLQGKPSKDIARYLDKAKSSKDKELARSAALCSALVSVRDGKLDDAAKALGAIDAGDDNRVKFQTALVAFMQNKTADAKPIVDGITAAQPDHDGARALAKKLATAVAKTDPMPPENGGNGGTHETPTTHPVDNGGGGGGGGDYDSLLAKANKLAETNCAKAMELFGKALEQKPTGVEALTGMGYCYLDAKQFASAFSKFRAALAVSNRYEPALGGVAETYQRQGNREQAIEAWHRYLDVIPDSAKAKKQLQILGDTGDKPAPTQGSAEGTPAPAPAPQPAAGSGSSS